MSISDGFAGSVGNTPLIRLRAVSEETGCEILGKAEFMNPGGSVKDRAARAIITAALGAASYASIPLTHRRLSQSVTFVAGHVLEDESLDWRSLAGPRRTVVFYMGVSHLDQIVAKLRDAGAKADHPVAIVERATLPGQRTVRGTLETIVAIARSAAIQAPALLIVGDVTTFLAAETALAAANKDGSMSHGALV